MKMDWKIGDSEQRKNREHAEIALEDEEFTLEDTSEEMEVELPEGIRLDVGVTELLGKSRSYVQGLIADGHVTVNGLLKKANYKVRSGDQIRILVPPPQ